MEHDISGRIGPLYGIVVPDAEVKMYSYERPAWQLWNAIYNGLRLQGWSDKDAVEWLQSKSPRWALDNELGDAIEKLGLEFAKGVKK